MQFSLHVVLIVFLETFLQLKGANLFTQPFCKLKPQCQKCKTLPNLLYWFPADTRILLWWPAFSIRDKKSTGHIVATSFTSLFIFLSPVTFITYLNTVTVPLILNKAKEVSELYSVCGHPDDIFFRDEPVNSGWTVKTHSASTHTTAVVSDFIVTVCRCPVVFTRHTSMHFL